MFSSFSFFAALPDLSMISLRVKNIGGTRLPDEPQISHIRHKAVMLSH
jgi:hypothetical protein